MADPVRSTQELMLIPQGFKPSYGPLHDITIYLNLFELQLAAIEAELVNASGWTPPGNPNALDTRIVATTGGTSSAYTVTFTDAFTQLVHGMELRITMHVSCALNATLQLDSLTAKNLTKDGANVSAGQMVADRQYIVAYNSISDTWEILSSEAAPAASQSINTGDRIAFFTEAPTGYSFVNSLNDRVPLLTSTAGEIGDTAGSWTVSGLTVLGHALTINEIPAHVHPHGSSTDGSVNRQAGLASTGGAQTTKNTSSVGGGQAHSHGLSSAGTWRPAYVKFGIYEKT